MIAHRIAGLLGAALLIGIGVVAIVKPSAIDEELQRTRAVEGFAPRFGRGMGCVLGPIFVAMGLLLAFASLFGKVIVK